VLPVGLFASPGYIQRCGMPESLADRDRHTIVGFDHVPSFAEASVSGLTLTRELFDVRTDSDLAQLALIQAGVGIGACQVQLGRKLGLVPVLPGAVDFTLPMWVVMHEDLKSTPRMRTVFDALVEGLGAYLSEPV
jgi:DNA-binding transcriptional LysR family regulator